MITSLPERRALSSNDCTLWEPKDLLLHYLRRIEGGEVFDGMLIAYVQRFDDKQIKTGMQRSQLRCLECVGLLEAVKQDLLEVQE